MSGETREEISGWTTDTLHAHIVALQRQHERYVALQAELRRADLRAARDAREAQDKLAAKVSAAAEAAVATANSANEKRLDNVNEWRSTFGELVSGYLSRTEYEAGHKALLDRVEGLKEYHDRTTGGYGALREGWQILLGLLVVAVSIYAALHR